MLEAFAISEARRTFNCEMPCILLYSGSQMVLNPLICLGLRRMVPAMLNCISCTVCPAVVVLLLTLLIRRVGKVSGVLSLGQPLAIDNLDVLVSNSTLLAFDSHATFCRQLNIKL